MLSLMLNPKPYQPKLRHASTRELCLLTRCLPVRHCGKISLPVALGTGVLSHRPGARARLWLCLHHSHVETIPHETSGLLPFLPSTEQANGFGDASGPRA